MEEEFKKLSCDGEEEKKTSRLWREEEFNGMEQKSSQIIKSYIGMDI